MNEQLAQLMFEDLQRQVAEYQGLRAEESRLRTTARVARSIMIGLKGILRKHGIRVDVPKEFRALSQLDPEQSR
jgi:hypothetical protein